MSVLITKLQPPIQAEPRNFHLDYLHSPPDIVLALEHPITSAIDKQWAYYQPFGDSLRCAGRNFMCRSA